MPVLNAILILCALLCAVFVWLYFHSAGKLPTPQQFHVYVGAGPERYRHLDRLFSHEDFDFLDSTAAGRALVPLLRRERRGLLRAILAELKLEFEAVIAVGSMLAASGAGRDEHLSANLVRETVTFYAVYSALLLYSFWPWAGAGGHLPKPLLEQVRALRRGTRGLMAALTEGQMEQLRVTIMGRP